MVTSTSTTASPFLRPNCPQRRALQLMADKWNPVVILLLRDGPLHFNALRRATGGISQKMMTQTLRKLEVEGLLNPHRPPDLAPDGRVRLTPLGASLLEPIDALSAWAERHLATEPEEDAVRRDVTQPLARRRPGKRFGYTLCSVHVGPMRSNRHGNGAAARTRRPDQR